MYWYALIGVLATAILIIENFDIFFSRGNYQNFPEIVIYRRFLYGILSYYITDILWGVLDSLGLTGLLFIDTVIYYVAMAVGVLFWTQYVVTYLGGNDFFSRFLTLAGRFCFAAVLTITIINFFIPVLFWFDEEGVYHACPLRHAQLIFQIVLLLLTSIYTLRIIPKAEGMSKKRYQTIFLFGLVVAILLLIQLPYPFLPLYTIGYMLGSSLLHSFVVSNEMDELLRRQSELAIAANEAKTSFLSNMSHEIRTPINAVLGMNEMVLRECEDENVLEYSVSIKTAGNTLLSIVNDILDFSKIEAGKMEITPIDYDLSSVLNDLVNMVATKADEKGLVLKLNFNPDTPKLLHGDEIRVKQIITNILSNAVKYTEKGSVTFSLDFEKRPEHNDSVFLRVAVSDTGIGIREEDIEKLFLKFDRIDEKRNRNIEGTGLGMNITKSLLEMMDSSLEVESVYGEGSVFSFCLEQKVVAWDTLGNYEDSYRSALLHRKKDEARFCAPEAVVLMVDDNPMNLMVFKNLLKRTGIKIDMAESGDEALEYSYRKKYDIIFLDHMMPGKDGIETLEELRARKDDPNLKTPMVCLTANAISGAREQYIEAGFDDYLTKPIDTAKLEEMLLEYLPKEKIREAGASDAGNAVAEPAKGESSDLPRESAQTAEALNPLKPLLGQEWIDVPLGIHNSGDSEAYLGMLKIFYDSLDSLAGDIEALYESGNWKDYTIKIHALKSSARIIGATAFGEEAQLLENAGKSVDVAYIREKHDGFMAEYRSFKAPLAELFADGNSSEDKPEADAVLMETVYDGLLSAAEDMDTEQIEDIFAEMEGYSIPDSDRELWDQLTEAANQFDYDIIVQLLEQH